MEKVSEYWEQKGKTLDDKKVGKKWLDEDNNELYCDECCWGDRCDSPSHFYRPECPYCLGTGTNKIDDEILEIDEDHLVMNANSGVISDFVKNAIKKDLKK